MILLTGATGGIGSLIIGKLSKIDEVIAVYNSTQPTNKLDNVTYLQLDINEAQQVDVLIKEYLKEEKHITVIHLAAIKIDGLALSYSKENWDKTVETNLTSPFLLTQKILPIMVENRYGRVIYTSSKGAVKGDVGAISYATSKSALLGMSNVLAKEYARFNITNNILMLGAFETGMYHELGEDKKREMLNSIPSKKLGSVGNIVNAIEFLMKSDFVNGTTITIDGASD